MPMFNAPGTILNNVLTATIEHKQQQKTQLPLKDVKKTGSEFRQRNKLCLLPGSDCDTLAF